MGKLGLYVRMIIASTVLLPIYLFLALIVTVSFVWLLPGPRGLWLIIGIPLVVAGHFFVTNILSLRREKGAKITSESHPELYERAQRLADELDIEFPDMYLTEEGVMNAYAIGRRGNGNVFFTKKLIDELSIEEIEPIIAHEFAHLRNRDSVLMGLATSMVEFISTAILYMFQIAMYLTPGRAFARLRMRLMQISGTVTATVTQLLLLIFVRMLSRYREFVADETAVKTTGQYDGMIQALEKMHQFNRQVENPEMSATRSAISFIGFFDGWFSRLLATHPSVEKRISRVEEIASNTGGNSETS